MPRASPLVVPQKNDGTVEVEREIHFVHTCLGHSRPQTSPVVGMAEQKTAAAGTDQLAAGRPAALAGDRVELVDAVVAHTGRAFALALPMLVHHRAEPADVAGLECSLDLDPQLLHE